MSEPRVIPLKPPSAPLDARSDDELMLLAKAGARDAFGVLARRYMDRVVRFCAKQTGDARAAEEIAQETWLYLWSTRATYVPQGKFVVLLFTAARHRASNYRRGSHRRDSRLTAPPEEGLPLLATAAPDHLDEILVQERQRRVLTALEQVPPKLREALLLRFAEGLSYEEMAGVLEAGESTIRSRVHHALKNIRALLGERT
jgi:RNA polymerase sigma-70 factor (ECF subfamily)